MTARIRFEVSSPHTRGCFLHRAMRIHGQLVFPAYAGVFPFRHSARPTSRSLPRIRGGVSNPIQRLKSCVRVFPAYAGVFPSYKLILNGTPVFPAYAGVFPTRPACRGSADRLPRIRGGVSDATGSDALLVWSSPHTRGCFSPLSQGAGLFVVFPAYAGVFLLMLTAEVSDEGLPRIRGGVSDVIFKK